MGTTLQIHTLGNLTISIDDTPVSGFDSRKVQALLVYLACTGRTQPREVLAELFWEERTQSQALANLRVALHSLNQTVGDFVEVTRDSVSLWDRSAIWLDTSKFELELAAAESNSAQLETALDLYQGDFLAGFFVDSSAFEQWATRERERLRLRAMDALDRLITQHMTNGGTAEGLRRATQLLAMDPLREETHRQMMDLLWRSGQRGKALEQYDTLCRLLDEEFGVTPLPETVSWYEQLRAGDTSASIAPATSVEAQAPVLPHTVVANPYKGLCAFDESDAEDFFGREALVERLLTRLAEDHPLVRFLAVVGPSGSGKSSVVRAGVLPALRRGALPGSEAWPIVTLLPGGLPFDELEIALRRAFPALTPTLFDDLRSDAHRLLRALRLCLPDDHQELLLVIDQFEEVFTLVGDLGEARRFLNALYVAATTLHSPVRILITLRADFYDRPLMIPDFSELVRQRTEVVTPMTPEELERAVSAPAERVGVSLEPGLVAAVVAEVSQQPGALPLMEYALTEVFDRRRDHALSLAAYEEVGGALGALAQRADQVYVRLTPERQAAARQMCLRLVTLGEGTEDTRRRTLQSELLAAAGGEATRVVLHAFDRARLLMFDRDPRAQQPTVELAHEAIIREWALLRTWLDESRDDIRQQRLLATAANEWEEAGQDRSYLLTGSRLAQFEGWAGQTGVALTPDERAFLEASGVEDQRRRALRRRARNTILVAALVVAATMTGMSLFAFRQRNDAEDARAASDANASQVYSLFLATNAQLVSAREPDLALALALDANLTSAPPPPAQRILSEIAYAPGAKQIFVMDRPEAEFTSNHHSTLKPNSDHSKLLLIYGSAYYGGSSTGSFPGVLLWDLTSDRDIQRWPGFVGASWIDDDQKILLMGTTTTLIWDMATNMVVSELPPTLLPAAQDEYFVSPDGSKLVVVTGIRTGIVIWDVANGTEMFHFGQSQPPIDGITINSDWTQVAVSRGGGNLPVPASIPMASAVGVWDLTTGTEVWRSTLRTFLGAEVAFSPDGQTLLVSDGGELSLLNAATGTEIRRFNGNRLKNLNRLLFSADGKTVLTDDQDSVILWDVTTGSEIRRLVWPGADIKDIALSQDEQQLYALVPEESSLRVMEWDFAPAAEIWRFLGHTDRVTGVALSMEGNTVVSSSNDRALIVWDTATGAETRRITSDQGGFSWLALSPDNRLVLTRVAGDNRLELWNIATGDELETLAGHTDSVLSAVFSPDGQMALSGSWDQSLILWDIATGHEIRRLTGHNARINSVAISPDGQLALSGGNDGIVVLWDLTTGTEIRRFVGHTQQVNCVTFSPDGQWALSGASDNLLILWDVTTGTEIRRFSGHTQAVLSTAFSPDSKTVLSGSRDTALILWDVASGLEIRRFTEHTGPVNSVVFSQDGKTALSGSADGQVILWRIDSVQELIAWARANRLIRDFTCEERVQYRIEPLCE